MSKNSIEQKPLESAIFAALHRAIAHRQFNNERFGPDYLAESFLPYHIKFLVKFNMIRAIIKKRLNQYLPGVYEYMIARTACFDDHFIDALNNRIPQIVLLCTGFDSRPYRFEKLNRGTKIIELDIAPTLNRKTNCLKKARIDIPEHVSFVPIDFDKESLPAVLKKAGFDTHKRTLFLWEGVSYYLEQESVNTMLEFVSHSAQNSIILFDYIISIPEENRTEYYGVKKLFQTMKKHHPDEELKFTIDEGKEESFLAQRRLKMVDHLDNDDIERTLLLNENGSLTGKVTGHFRLVSASPNI